MSKRVGTIAMTPSHPMGYDPIAAILSGEKRHTLRKRAVSGEREVTVGRQRTSIILRFTHSETMMREEFLTDEFARADGLPDAAALEALLKRFYREVPEQMVCSHFEVVTTEAEGEGLDVLRLLDKRFAAPVSRLAQALNPPGEWVVNEAGRMERTGG